MEASVGVGQRVARWIRDKVRNRNRDKREEHEEKAPRTDWGELKGRIEDGARSRCAISKAAASGQ